MNTTENRYCNKKFCFNRNNKIILIKRGETAKYTAAPLFFVNYSLSDKIICKLLKRMYTVIQ